MANNYLVILSFSDILVYAKDHNIFFKFKKALKYLAIDIRHPSLNTELLNPKHRGIYSFRVDKKYRGMFFFNKKGEIEVFALTNHYK
jgi:Txe/YoeB family toxin of Txe-Axe toxin-antitoxin module